ncbi:hypothetical protein AGMMS49921_01560 [Endomicrobiia bacterium]|nr:hypothetical protein AGMMS49921_01560 [Endomicrobiia bacterium]
MQLETREISLQSHPIVIQVAKKGSPSKAHNNNIPRQVSTAGGYKYINPNDRKYITEDNIKLGVSDIKVITDPEREVGQTRVDLLGSVKIDDREIKIIQNGRLENSGKGKREIAIKDGTYRLGIITRPPREPELWLQNQHDRTEILVHLGDDGRWSQGCLIIPNKDDLKYLVEYVSKKYKEKTHVYLTISTSKEVKELKGNFAPKIEALYDKHMKSKKKLNDDIGEARIARANMTKKTR